MILFHYSLVQPPNLVALETTFLVVCFLDNSKKETELEKAATREHIAFGPIVTKLKKSLLKGE